MLMDGRLALPPDWKDQQLMLQRRSMTLYFASGSGTGFQAVIS